MASLRKRKQDGGAEGKPLLAPEKPKPSGKGKGPAAPFKVTPNLPVCSFFNPLAWALLAVDTFLIIVTFKWRGLFGPRAAPTVEVPPGARRLACQSDKLIDTCFGCKTAYELVARAFSKYANKQAMGTRKYLGMHTVKGERFPMKKFGATEWSTYKEVGIRAHDFGAGLIQIGMVALPKDEGTPGGTDFEKTTKPHTLLVYEETSADWMTALMGAHSQSLVVATSYATLGMGAVADATNECNVKCILCNYKDVGKVAGACKTMPSLTHVIYTTVNVTAEDVARPPSVAGVTVMSMDEVVDLGSRSNMKPNPPTPDNMAVIMYTSGSTGKPKGVMIRQKNMCASAGMLLQYVGDSGVLHEGEETYIAYLPAAHIFELCVEFAMLSYGGRVGYSDPRSFSSKGACRLDEDTGELHLGAKMAYPADEAKNFAPGGLQAFRPTFMVAVPKIWDILKKGVEAKLARKSAIVRSLVHFGFAWRNFLLHRGMDSIIFGFLFRKLFANVLGGRQKVFATGGGPIASEVQSFIRTIFCCPLVQGYALTETCCAGTLQQITDPRDGVVGPPAGSVEIMLRDCTEPSGEPSVRDRNGSAYLSSDRSHYGEACSGRGEVLIRGHSVSAGYLKKPEKTMKEFDKDGWFHTGDIAIFTPDGCIKIVDRLKNLVKLKGGEYVAIESMEKEYSKSVFVNGINGGIMCYGDGDMDRPVAMVQVDLSELRKWASANGVPADDDEALCANAAAVSMVLNDLNREGKKGGVGRNEKLVAIALISGNGSKTVQELNSPWTSENAFLTASNKLQRKQIVMGQEKIHAPLKLKGIR